MFCDIDIRNANLLKAEFTTPVFDERGELLVIDNRHGRYGNRYLHHLDLRTAFAGIACSVSQYHRRKYHE